MKGFPKNSPMIFMNSSTRVEKLKLDARHIATVGIRSTKRKALSVNNVMIMNTKYDFSRETKPRYGFQAHGIYFYDCDNVTITNNIIFDIGVNKIGPSARNWFGYERVTRGNDEYNTNWSANGSGIRVYKSHDVTILNNKINNTATGGIEIGGSRNVNVGYNLIRNTARNRDFSLSALSDGIAGYHNSHLQRTAYRYWNNMGWKIYNNTIINSNNHGIHVSGRGIVIKENKIFNSTGRGIYVGDWRGHPNKVFHRDNNITECSKDIVIEKNLVSNSGQEEIRVAEFKRVVPTSYDGSIIDRDYRNTMRDSSNTNEWGTTLRAIYYGHLKCEK